MSLKTKILAAMAAFLMSVVPAALAQEYKAGPLVIGNPWAKATLPNQPVASGFFSVSNTGEEADRLVSIEAGFSGEVRIHAMAMENDVMKMRALSEGLDIPAGGTVTLEPGAYHVMFMKLSGPLKEGERREAVLNFEKAGPVEVEFEVETARPAPGAAETNHGGMGRGGDVNGHDAGH